MKQIRKDYVLAMLVRTFFKFFTTAVAERAAQDGLADPLSARNIKQMMLNHYEQISKVYNQEAFYCLSRMNYEAETVEQHLRDFTLRNGSKPTDIAIQRRHKGNCIVRYSRLPFALFFTPPASV